MTDATVPDWARRPSARRDAPPDGAETAARPTRLALVGPCASGKSTLAAALTADGYEIHVCAQEHSEVGHLWALSEPDLVIYLSVDLDHIRRRRGSPTWSEAIYRRQLRRLQGALAGCAIYIDTSARTAEETLAVARAALAATGVAPPASVQSPAKGSGRSRCNNRWGLSGARGAHDDHPADAEAR